MVQMLPGQREGGRPVPQGDGGQQALPMGRGLECLQTRFEEIQGLEKEGGAGATDGTAQESLDRRVQLQDKRTLSSVGRSHRSHLVAPSTGFKAQPGVIGLQGCWEHSRRQGELSGPDIANLAPTERCVYFMGVPTIKITAHLLIFTKAKPTEHSVWTLNGWFPGSLAIGPADVYRNKTKEVKP